MNRYKNKTVQQLIKIAQRYFNKYIRKRDLNKPCINCGKYGKLQAGHYYPTSTHSGLRFNEDNVHGECLHCNYFNSQSHAYGYQVNIQKRIGSKRFEKLMLSAGHYKRYPRKWTRFELIDIIEKYKTLSE